MWAVLEISRMLSISEVLLLGDIVYMISHDLRYESLTHVMCMILVYKRPGSACPEYTVYLAVLEIWRIVSISEVLLCDVHNLCSQETRICVSRIHGVCERSSQRVVELKTLCTQCDCWGWDWSWTETIRSAWLPLYTPVRPMHARMICMCMCMRVSDGDLLVCMCIC